MGDDDLRGSPEAVYYRFMELIRSGDITGARRLTNGRVRIVARDSVDENAGYLNVEFFRQQKSTEPILVDEKLAEDRCLIRTGSAYFYLARQHGKWLITKAGLKPID
jgi:hypothetical protein